MSQRVRIALLAPAKLNLTLLVLGKRSDGYHELESLVGLIDLCDKIEIELRGEAGPIEIRCDSAGVPTGPENLAHKAAAAMFAACGCERAASISLNKRIPVGGGLGGGSSDAAAVLCGLNVLMNGALPQDRLAGIAATIGSDVPFFLSGAGLGLMRGRGEIVQPLDAAYGWVAVLLLPGIPCDTRRVYGAFEAAESASGVASTGEVAAALRSRASRAELMSLLQNDLEPVARIAVPEFAMFLDQVRQRLDPHWRMSGSGSTMFTLCGSVDEARVIADGARGRLPGVRVEIAPLLHSPPRPELT